MKTSADIIDHEVRIRLLEKIAETINHRFDQIESKIDSHFKWTVATMIGLFATVVLPFFGGILLHMAKLI